MLLLNRIILRYSSWQLDLSKIERAVIKIPDFDKDRQLGNQMWENKENTLNECEIYKMNNQETIAEPANQYLQDSNIKVIPPTPHEQISEKVSFDQDHALLQRFGEVREQNKNMFYRGQKMISVAPSQFFTRAAPFSISNTSKPFEPHISTSFPHNSYPILPQSKVVPIQAHFIPAETQRNFPSTSTHLQQKSYPNNCRSSMNNSIYRHHFSYQYQTLLKTLTYDFGKKNVLKEAIQGNSFLMTCPEVTFPLHFLLSPNAHDGNPSFAKALVDLAIAVKTSILKQSRRCAPASLYPILFPLYKLAWDIAKNNQAQRTNEFKEAMTGHWIWWLEVTMKGPFKKPAEKVGPFWDDVRRQLNIQMPRIDDHERRAKFEDEMFQYEIKWQNRYARVYINRWKW